MDMTESILTSIKKLLGIEESYTHFDPDLKRKGKVATDSELVPLVDKMQSLLEICFLKELGITGLPIRRIIHRSNTSQYFTLGEEKPPHASDQNPQLSP